MTGERAFTATEFALSMGLVLLPVTLIVLSLPTWLEYRSFASTAAQEAAREAVLADTPGAATTAGRTIIDRIAANLGVDPQDVSICFTVHDTGTAAAGGCRTGVAGLPRGGAVTARVSVRMPALSFPVLGTTFEAFTYGASHTERVDDYRSFPS